VWSELAKNELVKWKNWQCSWWRVQGCGPKSIEIHLMKKLDKVAWEAKKWENVEPNLTLWLWRKMGKIPAPHMVHPHPRRI